jgi:heme/copper-type cytochrome/quinol oxidase subunit 3
MIMKKLYSLLLLTIISIPTFARGELYAWHESNNTGGTPIIFFVISGFFSLFVGFLLLSGWFNDVSKGECTKESNRMGCLGFLFILTIILGTMIRCS